MKEKKGLEIAQIGEGKNGNEIYIDPWVCAKNIGSYYFTILMNITITNKAWENGQKSLKLVLVNLETHNCSM